MGFVEFHSYKDGGRAFSIRLSDLEKFIESEHGTIIHTKDFAPVKVCETYETVKFIVRQAEQEGR